MKHLGGKSELVACAWLLGQGYEVFRNVSDRGLIDIIAVKNGVTFLFDVKSAKGKNRPCLTQQQIDQGVWPLYVFPDGKCIADRDPKVKWEGVETICTCGSIFLTTYPRQIYCSKYCQKRNTYNKWKNRREERIKKHRAELGLS